MLFPLTRRPVSVVFWFWASHHYFRLDRVPAVSSTSFWLTVIHSVSHSISGRKKGGLGFMVYQKIQQMNRGRTVSLPRWQAPKRTHALDNWMHRRVVSSVTQMKLHLSVHYDAGAWKEPFDSYSYSCRARPRLFGRLIGCASKWESARHVCRWLRTISW